MIGLVGVKWFAVAEKVFETRSGQLCGIVSGTTIGEVPRIT